MWQLYAGLGLFAAGAIAGWTVNDWRNDSIALAAERGAQHAITENRAREASIAAEAETRIAALRTKERVTNNTITREIIKHADTYNLDCATADGVRAYNDFAAGRASKPAAALPR